MKPVLQALLLADYVYDDARTGKKIIAGVFHTYYVAPKPQPQEETPAEGQEKPVQEPPEPRLKRVVHVERAGTPFVYISLTDLRGPTDLQLRLVSLTTNEVCFETEPFTVERDSPLATAEIFNAIPSLPTRPGVYALELLCHDEPLGAHRITVREFTEERP